MPERPTLFHYPNTRSNAANWLNEELGAPCDIQLVDLKAADQKATGFKRLNQMGKVPVLLHQSQVVTETAAVCAYLADAYSNSVSLAPATSNSLRGYYYRWLFFAPSCVEPTVLDVLSNVKRSNPGSAGHGAVENVLLAIDQALKDSDPYLLGNKFTAADVVFGTTLNFALQFGAFEKTPLRTDYVERLFERPAAVMAAKKNIEYVQQLSTVDEGS